MQLLAVGAIFQSVGKRAQPMIHVVTIHNQHLYAEQLEEMFQLRHRFYVEEHGWSGLTSRDGKETDEFDNADAVYLLNLDPFAKVTASVRLNPTTGPTLLHKFSDYAAEPLPRDTSVWDVSRWMAKPEHRRGDSKRWRNDRQRELMVAIHEFCVSRGATRIITLSELRLAERAAAYGWPTRLLGVPREYEHGKGVAVAAEIETGPHVLAFTRARTGINTSVLIEIDARSIVTPLCDRIPEIDYLDNIDEHRLERLCAALAVCAAQTASSPVEAMEINSRVVVAGRRLREVLSAGQLTGKSVNAADRPMVSAL